MSDAADNALDGDRGRAGDPDASGDEIVRDATGDLIDDELNEELPVGTGTEPLPAEPRTRAKNLRKVELDFMKDCVEAMEGLSEEKALDLYDTSNNRAWLFYPSRRGCQPSRERFMARAVGLWWPSRCFEEMRGAAINCPRCGARVDVSKGTWIPFKEVREVASLSTTWLLLGRIYRCPGSCRKHIRNTSDDFLLQCPELTRHRFGLILRPKMAIERDLVQLLYPLWVNNGSTAVDTLLGSHVRYYERSREQYLQKWAQAVPRTVKADKTSIPGLFAAQQASQAQQPKLEKPSLTEKRDEAEAEKLLMLETRQACKRVKHYGKAAARKLGEVMVAAPGAGGETIRRPIRVIEVLELWTDNYILSRRTKAGPDGASWYMSNVPSLVKGHDGKNASKDDRQYITAMQNYRRYMEAFWSTQTQRTVQAVRETLRRKAEREARNEAARAKPSSDPSQSRSSTQDPAEAADSGTAAPSLAPEDFGSFTDPEGYNGLRFSRFFIDSVCHDLFRETARPKLRELVSVPARIVRIDCTFRVASRVQVQLRSETNTITIVQPFEALLSVVNEHNQVCCYQGLRDGENLAGELDRALRSFKAMREEMDSNYKPEVIYTDRCCHERRKLQAIWPGVLVRLDPFHFLARFDKVMAVDASHPLRKHFNRAMSNALFIPDAELLQKHTGGAEHLTMNRLLQAKIPRRVPPPGVLHDRVLAVLDMFIDSDTEAFRARLRSSMKRDGEGNAVVTSREGAEDVDIDHLKHLYPALSEADAAELLDLLRMVPGKRRLAGAQRLVRDKGNVQMDNGKMQKVDFQKFMKTMLRHIEKGCLSDLEDVTLHTLHADKKGFFTARGTNNNERLNRAFNKAFGDRALGVVRADIALLETASAHNRASAALLLADHRRTCATHFRGGPLVPTVKRDWVRERQRRRGSWALRPPRAACAQMANGRRTSGPRTLTSTETRTPWPRTTTTTSARTRTVTTPQGLGPGASSKMQEWDEEDKLVPRGFTQTRSSTSTPLQVCLQFNVYMSAIFVVLESAALSQKLTLYELDVFGQVLAPLAFGVWCASEIFRLWFGFTGNLQEKLPQISVFLLLSLFPQLPCLLYLMNLQELQFPMEKILGGIMFAFTGVELVIGYYAVQALVRKQTTSYSRLISQED